MVYSTPYFGTNRQTKTSLAPTTEQYNVKLNHGCLPTKCIFRTESQTNMFYVEAIHWKYEVGSTCPLY